MNNKNYKATFEDAKKTVSLLKRRGLIYDWDNYSEDNFLEEAYKINTHYWCTPTYELEIVRDFAKRIENGLFLELGSFLGSTSIGLGDILKKNNNRLICVDRVIYKSFFENIYAFDLQEHISFLPLDSFSATRALDMLNKRFDLIFIDTDHDSESVRCDIAGSLRILKEDGILCGHDYYLPETPESFYSEGLRERMKTHVPDDIKDVAPTVHKVLGKENIQFKETIWWLKGKEKCLEEKKEK